MIAKLIVVIEVGGVEFGLVVSIVARQERRLHFFCCRLSFRVDKSL